MPGGGVREFRPGQEFIPGGGMGLAANAGEFVPGGGIGGVREFRPGQEFIPGGGMALATNAGEFVPSFVAQQMGAGREFVPGHQFIPGGMDSGYDGQGSMMQAIPDDDVGDYGDDGAVYDENGEYVDGNEYADDEEEGWMEITATVIGSGTPHPDNAVVYAAFDSAEELIWSGSASGRLSSHWVQFEEPNPEEYLDNQPPSLPTLRVVTQVRVFKDCPVRHILAGMRPKATSTSVSSGPQPTSVCSLKPTSVCGLKLLVYAALSFDNAIFKLYAALSLLVYTALSY
jgi:hypothetical protein